MHTIAKVRSTNNLASFCVYTMRHSTELDAQMKTSEPHVLTEGKAWVTGRLLWDRARRSGELMPVVFSSAEDEQGLIYWASIHDIAIADFIRPYAICHTPAFLA